MIRADSSHVPATRTSNTVPLKSVKMQRQAKSLSDVVQLVQIADLISNTVKTIIAEWSREAEELENPASTTHAETPPQILPSYQLFDAQRTILAATGKLTELVSEPSSRILEVATQFQESRALYIAAERRIPDILASKDEGQGMHVSEISKEGKIESRKLCKFPSSNLGLSSLKVIDLLEIILTIEIARLLRYLCSIGIFRQTGRDVFANNSISVALVSNEPLRAYVQMVNSEGFTASDRLPKTLLDPERGASYDADKTAWQDAVNTTKIRWDWLEERIEQSRLIESGGHYPGIPSLILEPKSKVEDGLVARPELEIMGLAMVGGGQVFGAAHVYGIVTDFPIRVSIED